LKAAPLLLFDAAATDEHDVLELFTVGFTFICKQCVEKDTSPWSNTMIVCLSTVRFEGVDASVSVTRQLA